MRHSFILVLTILFFISCTPPTPEPVNKKTVDLGTDDNATEQPKFYTIIKIIDGDTIKIDFEGKKDKIYNACMKKLKQHIEEN